MGRDRKAEKQKYWNKNKSWININRRMSYIGKSEKEKEEIRAYQKSWSIKNRGKKIRNTKKYRDGLRYKCLGYYSNGKFECNCCFEKEIKFLAIDHVNDDGAKHRKEVGSNIMLWLIKNNYPDGFQVLCHNCNMAKAFYGVCPHKVIPT